MDYRDDREALRLRAEQLERERDEAKQALERERAEMREAREREKREAKESRRRGGADPAKRTATLVAWGAGTAVAIGIGGFVALQTAAPVASVPAASAPVAAAAPPPAPAPLDRHVTTGWEGTVKAATGRSDVAVGAPCRMDGRFASDGTSRVEADVDVACAGTTLYRWADPIGSGMEMRQCDVWEGPGDVLGSLRYKLRCQDHGMRSGGRPQLTVDTFSGSVVVWQEAPPVWRVEIEVATFTPSTMGTPLYVGNVPQDPGFRETVERTGTVSAVTGSAPAAVGTRCAVRVQPNGSRLNCRVEVACGGEIAYGGGEVGFTNCTVEAGQPVRASDLVGSQIEGDPKLEMDLAAGTVVVADDPPTGAWSMTIALEPPTTGTARAR